MSSLPSVSLVVLNWNGKAFLSDCLESLLKLDYPPEKLEIILADNGSEDGSAEYVREEFPGVKLVALDRNHGFAEGNNLAAEQARGDWVGFLNNDMHVPADWLRQLVAPLEARPGVVCLASKILNWDGSAVDFVGGGVNFQGHGFQPDHGLPRSDHDVARPLLFACGGAMLVRADCYRELGGFDPDYFAFFEDVDLGWRLNLLGYDVWYTPAAVAYHHHHGTAAKVPPFKLRTLYERNALYTIYKCFDDDNLAAALPAALIMLNEKALRIAHTDLGAFHWPPADAGTPQPRPAPSAAAAPTPARRPASTRKQPEGILAKAVRLTRDEGFSQMVFKAQRLARWRWAMLRMRLRVTRLGSHAMPLISISHYAALSEFAHDLDRTIAKRRWLQERRRRTDAELLPLFHNALDPSYNDVRYIEFHRWLCDVLGLDVRFARGRE